MPTADSRSIRPRGIPLQPSPTAISRLPELLLPAGGFDSAIAAIEGGADALYLGLSEFSARKQARNFDRLEYRRLFRLARERGIRLYVAINTILAQDELARAASLLAFLGRFPPDAIIVQDWGLASLVRDRHPGIAIHASTQAAVQGAEGARIARELGVSRVVLPRETSLEEMQRLHAEVPEMEYEAFIHGALCYSFSGLCLASGLVLGRSGNRGECAQLCRSYYEMRGRSGYWFSCRDLELGFDVSALSAAGIGSLKVEGRMKSPEYCFAVARLYRGILDRLAGDGPDEEEMASRFRAARTVFSRSPTAGWLRERGGACLVDSAYPGHRGIVAGRISRLVGAGSPLISSPTLGSATACWASSGATLRAPAVSGRRPARSPYWSRARAGRGGLARGTRAEAGGRPLGRIESRGPAFSDLRSGARSPRPGPRGV